MILVILARNKQFQSPPRSEAVGANRRFEAKLPTSKDQVQANESKSPGWRPQHRPGSLTAEGRCNKTFTTELSLAIQQTRSDATMFRIRLQHRAS